MHFLSVKWVLWSIVNLQNVLSDEAAFTIELVVVHWQAQSYYRGKTKLIKRNVQCLLTALLYKRQHRR